MKRILIVGDFSDKIQISFAESACDYYSEKYEVVLSGHYIESLDERYKEKSKKITSLEYTYCVETADVVIITDMIVRFHKRKRNQQVFIITEDISDNIDLLMDSNLDYLVCNNSDDTSLVEKVIGSSNIRFVSNECNEVEDTIKWIDTRMYDEETDLPDILFFASSDVDSLVRTNPDFQVFLDDVSKYRAYNLGQVTLERGSCNDYFTNDYSLSDEKRLVKVLKTFSGVAIFENETIKEMFFLWMADKEIDNSFSNVLTINQVSLFPLFEKTHEKARYLLADRENYDENAEYKNLLRKSYKIHNCENICVSVVICRYNTKEELLFRAIDSVFESTHKNVEVIVVDDGSKNSIENVINERYIAEGKNIKYYFKENEGLGLSRNYGVERSTGRYFFFLDSDDTITNNGIELLLAHAVHFNLSVVCGKRVLCDEDGNVINESLPNLMGNTYKVYGNKMPGLGINDCMVNNKLIKKSFAIKYKLRFERGVYEDVEYSAKMYNVCDCFHIANIHIHNWYQYDSMSTLSSNISFDNFLERYNRTLVAWDYTPEQLRESRLASVVNSEMMKYFSYYSNFNDGEKLEFWEKIRDFIVDRADYIDELQLSKLAKHIVKSAIKDSYEYFSCAINRFCKKNHTQISHDDYIVFTHYHIITAITYVLDRKVPSRLFIAKGYNSISNVLIARLKRTGLFDDVIEFDGSSGVTQLYEGLMQRPKDAYAVIPSCLNIPYRNVFSMCDFERDTVFFVSDTLPYWYYVEKSFKNIVKLEDAYNSFKRELEPMKIWGKWSCITPYIGKYYPEDCFRSDNIRKIIISQEIDGLPDKLRKKVVIKDTKLLIDKHKDEIGRILVGLYDFDIKNLNENTVMVLTQPLAQYGYCTRKEQKVLYKRICKRYNNKNIVIKPHPADKMNYTALGMVLNRAFPIEVLNFTDVRIDTVITFGSSAIDTVEFAKNKIALFPLSGFEFDDVTRAIKKITRDKITTKLKNRIKKFIKK